LKKLGNKCIVWPTYFDSSKTRGEGRKIPKRLALESPRLEEVIEAANALKLNPKPNWEAKYPRSWWQKSGYVILDKPLPKSKILNLLAEKMVEIRKQKRIFTRKV